MCKNTTPHQRSVGSCIFIAKIIKNRTIDEVISKSQGLNGVYPKIDVPPLSLSGFSPTTQLGAVLYKIIRRSRGNTDAIDFVAIASSLQATNGIRGVCNTNRLKAVPLRFVRRLRNNTAQSLVLRTQGLPHGKNKRTSACISKMKAKFFAVWEEEHKEPRRTTTTCCG